MNFRIAAILMLGCLLLLFPARSYSAAADEEAARLFDNLRAAGAQMGAWSLADIQSDGGAIRTNWKNTTAAGELRIILQARNEAAPSFAMTRLYNVFVESGSGGSMLSDNELELLDALLVYIRANESTASTLEPFDEFKHKEEKRRVEDVKKQKTEAARLEDLRRRSFDRLLPAGLTVRDFGDKTALLLLPVFLIMLAATLFISKITQLELELSVRVYLRDIFNRAFKFIVIFQAGLAARYFDPNTLINLVNSPLVPAARPFDAVSNTFVYFMLGGGEVRYIGALLLMMALFFLFLHGAMLLSFLVFKERMHALVALVFTASYPWFLLPAEALLPMLIFGWLFTQSMLCAILLSRFSHHEWKLGIIMALLVAVACFFHPLGLIPALFVPLAALFNISSSRIAIGRFSNWIAWFAGVLASAMLLFKLQFLNSSLAYGGVFAGSPMEIINNIMRLCWFDISIGSLPHLIFLVGGLVMLLRRSAVPELPLIALMLVGGALLCAVMPLSPQHPLLYSGLPGLAGLAAAPAVRAVWVYFEYKPFPVRLTVIAAAVLLSAASPFLADFMG